MKSVGLDMLGVGLTLAVLLMSINQALCASSCERAANSSKDSRVWWVPRATSCMLSVQCGQGPPLSHLTGVEKLVFVFRWDPKTKRCTPDLCDGVKLADIPDASGYPAKRAGMPGAQLLSLGSYEAQRCIIYIHFRSRGLT